jgi:hypothetical protein
MDNFKAAVIKQVTITLLNNYRHFLLGRVEENLQEKQMLSRAMSLDSCSFAELVTLSFSEIRQDSCLFFLNKLFKDEDVLVIEDLSVEKLNKLIFTAYEKEVVC